MCTRGRRPSRELSYLNGPVLSAIVHSAINTPLPRVLRLPRVGFLERPRAVAQRRPYSRLPRSIDLQRDAGHAIIAELADELAAVLLDGPDVFSGSELARCRRALGA
jgi:hypothetical protein